MLAKTDADAASIVALTGGQPYVLQGLLEQYWEKRDLQLATRQFLKARGGGLFRKWLTAFGDEGRAVYSALVDAGGQATLKEIRLHAKVDDVDAFRDLNCVFSRHRHWFLDECGVEHCVDCAVPNPFGQIWSDARLGIQPQPVQKR